MSHKKGTMILPFYREDNSNTERMCNLPTITELISGLNPSSTAWVCTLNHSTTVPQDDNGVPDGGGGGGGGANDSNDDDPMSLAPC